MKKIKQFIITGLLILGVQSTCLATIPASEIKIDSIGVGDSITTVIERYGKTYVSYAMAGSSTVDFTSGTYCYFPMTGSFAYPHYIFSFNRSNNLITSIEVKSKIAKTPRGLSVGNSKTELQSLYGKPDSEISFGDQTTFYYHADDSRSCKYMITMKQADRTFDPIVIAIKIMNYI